ncbi:MAG TPA: acyl-CoA dehydrogenase family protein [Thermoanaerobaculia bacterium]|jgi:acyl-CoA dehydrogenase|nr:acyl-CoA dehydrogenase family protein [Thermoanaerobaculia bacterium]
MDFNLDPHLIELRDRVAAFVRDEVIPAEPLVGESISDDVVAKLRERARAAGIYGPQLPPEYGGMGLGTVAMCVLFEQAGRSFLGPLAMHCSAPDEGNMHLLSLFATEEQKAQYLAPLVSGHIRSCFAMTEPAPGAGSDPTMMQTRATKVEGGWQIDGLKWFTSGAEGASVSITMAVTDPDAPSHRRVTMFLVPTDTPGYRLVRAVPVMGGHGLGGHCEVAYDNVIVPDSAVLGEVGDGFRMAQVRLGPARLTHCMRWLGVAQRSLEIAIARAKERDAFGKKLAEHQSIQWMIADSEIDLHASRLMVLDAAWKHENGSEIRHESSICKVFVAEAINRVIDRAVQICGALGYSGDTPLELFFREARAFRIYDGPSEVHRMVIARNVLR